MKKPTPITEEYVNWLDSLAHENSDKAKEIASKFTKDERFQIMHIYVNILLGNKESEASKRAQSFNDKKKPKNKCKKNVDTEIKLV